jgi:hypothetical protein
MSRSPHTPTPETRAEVRALASFGVTHEQVSTYLGIDAKTLRKHYREELDTSALKVHARVASFLANAATGAALKQDTGATYRDCLTAAIFYGKTRMGLKETTGMEHTSPDGSMTPTAPLTPAAIKAIAKQLDDEC